MNKSYVVSLITGMLIMLQSICCHAHSGYIINTTDSDMIINIYSDNPQKKAIYSAQIPPQTSILYKNESTGKVNLSVTVLLTYIIKMKGSKDPQETHLKLDPQKITVESMQRGGDYIIYKNGDKFDAVRR